MRKRYLEAAVGQEHEALDDYAYSFQAYVRDYYAYVPDY